MKSEVKVERSQRLKLNEVRG